MTSPFLKTTACFQTLELNCKSCFFAYLIRTSPQDFFPNCLSTFIKRQEKEKKRTLCFLIPVSLIRTAISLEIRIRDFLQFESLSNSNWNLSPLRFELERINCILQCNLPLNSGFVKGSYQTWEQNYFQYFLGHFLYFSNISNLNPESLLFPPNYLENHIQKVI